ncbi:coiled-coil domain-containing protein [Motilibacter deserti]|uniref:Cellulose-binding protein n=1 Tax=Motilibacter deserti TaxID=2714956 RepID=A0ABX0GSH1_9ACTN|nr:cellulose-binding protein [Motilibacter deserti]NHC13717.1 cellulose-binding protein [Motilibacter deserti]
MTDSAPQFAISRRGYEPAQVDSFVTQLRSQLEYAQSQAADLARTVDQLQRAAEEARASSDTSAPTTRYEGLGARIEQILTLAEEEAAQLRDAAAEDARRQRELTEQAAQKQRTEAERYATELRADADAQSARTLEDARRQADTIRDEADREAAARREEAEALFESQRARAAEAAADFETTLAERRRRAEAEFAERTAAAERQFAEAQERAEQLRVESEKLRQDAERKAARTVEESERQAEELVGEAKTRAAQIRAESERELIAATQRRDSINAQLTNVRRMLATLGGAAMPNPLGDLGPEGSAQSSGTGAEPAAAGPEVVDLTVLEAQEAGAGDRGQEAEHVLGEESESVGAPPR